MQNFLRFGTYIPISLLIACGGGGGGGAAGGPPLAPSTQMSAMVAPAQWPVNTKPNVTVASSALINSTELANTTNTADEIFVQIWYVNQQQERVDVAMLTLDQFTQMGGTITLTTVPVGTSVLKSEIYTAQGVNQLTLSTRDISI